MGHNRLHKIPSNSQQYVLLSGLGLDAFERNVEAISAIRQAFDGQVSEGDLPAWKPNREHGSLALPFSNRFFTASRDCGKEQPVDLSIVDPLRILRTAVPDGMHTDDNEVLYFERLKATEDATTFVHFPTVLTAQLKFSQSLSVPSHGSTRHQTWILSRSTVRVRHDNCRSRQARLPIYLTVHMCVGPHRRSSK